MNYKMSNILTALYLASWPAGLAMRKLIRAMGKTGPRFRVVKVGLVSLLNNLTLRQYTLKT